MKKWFYQSIDAFKYLNTSIGCSFNFNQAGISSMVGSGTYHTAPGSYSKEYFIRCQDPYNNTNVGCGIDIKDVIL